LWCCGIGRCSCGHCCYWLVGRCSGHVVLCCVVVVVYLLLLLLLFVLVVVLLLCCCLLLFVVCCCCCCCRCLLLLLLLLFSSPSLLLSSSSCIFWLMKEQCTNREKFKIIHPKTDIKAKLLVYKYSRNWSWQVYFIDIRCVCKKSSYLEHFALLFICHQNN